MSNLDTNRKLFIKFSCKDGAKASFREGRVVVVIRYVLQHERFRKDVMQACKFREQWQNAFILSRSQDTVGI